MMCNKVTKPMNPRLMNTTTICMSILCSYSITVKAVLDSENNARLQAATCQHMIEQAGALAVKEDTLTQYLESNTTIDMHAGSTVQKSGLTGESLSPGVSSVKKFRPPPAPELCLADDVLDRAACTAHHWNGAATYCFA